MIDVEVEAPAWITACPACVAVVEAVAEAVLVHEAREGEGVTVLLADDASVADLNQRFRGKSGPTNVLSFPAAPNPEAHLGDIALAYGVCAREAAEQDKPLGQHLQHLVAHGVFHLLGYDHMTEAEAGVMEGLERVVLAELGAPDPYGPAEGEHDRPGSTQ